MTADTIPGRIRLLIGLLPPPGRLGQRRESYPSYAADVDAAEAGRLPATQWTDGWVPDVATDGGPGAATVSAAETLWQIGVAVQSAGDDPAATLAQVRPMGDGPARWLPRQWLQAVGAGGDPDPGRLAAACRDSVPGLRAAETGWLWHGLPGEVGTRARPPDTGLFVPALAELAGGDVPADLGRRRWLLGALAAL